MDFETLYRSLNENQRKAVDTVDGCVMVVAGPGTGKTQVMGARVASILSKTDTDPENILCLTFTEAAATALRNRLYTFIGSASHRVNIQTYHGFCNQVIQENKDLFGIHDLSPVSDLEVVEVLKEIIDELPNDHELKRFRGEVYYDSANLRKLFSLMKKDGLTPDDVNRLIEEKLEFYRTDESMFYKRKSGEFNKGDFKINDFNTRKAKLDKLLAASGLLRSYEDKLTQRKRYDFDDMIAWVLEVFDDHPEVLLQYQERYHYFLVDEYQDTNGVQNQLLYQLISYWENPNVFVVGDDDQSIYKFQGANVENIHQFYERYRRFTSLIVLDKNYRSSQQILDGSNKVISHNNERLVGRVEGLTKDIQAANPEVSDLKDAVHIYEYPNQYQEVVSVASNIKALKDQGIALNEIAVLYRNHAQSEALIRYLESEQIDYNVVRTTNVLNEPLIDQLNSMLQYIDLESEFLDSGQHLLFKLLHFRSFEHLSAFDIARLSKFFSTNRKQGGWRTLLHNRSWKDELQLGNAARQELERFVSDTEYWIKEKYNLTLQDLVERIMSRMGFISRALSNADATFQVQCLKTYYNFLKSETARYPRLTLSEFLAKIDLLQQNNIGLNLNKVIHGENGVNLMTVHGSKGLEFDHVFLIGCTESKWEKDRTRLPFSLGEIIAGEPKSAMEEESRRLFYVALTRARRNITVSYAIKDDKDKDQARSVYVVELEESGITQTVKAHAPENELIQFMSHLVAHHDEGYQDLISQDFVQHMVENFRMNTTALNHYLRCPVSFFYHHIIRVPSAKNETMTFGSSMHYAMEGIFNEGVLESKEQATRVLTQRYRSFMNNNSESFTPEGMERRMHYGEVIIGEYVERYFDEWKSLGQVETEVYLTQGEIDGVPISGVIDKMIVNGKEVHVVDYKTGKYVNAKKKVLPPVSLKGEYDGDDPIKRDGGDYWRQILFYKALIESDPRTSYKVLSGEIEYLEPEDDEFHRSKVVVSAEEYAFVRNQIKTVYEKIQRREFARGCNEDDCEWCQFNNRYLARSEYKSDRLLDTRGDEIDER